MDYANFELADFVADDYFIRWVTHPDDATDQFWDAFLATHPQQAATLVQARQFVQSLERVQQQGSDHDAKTVARMWQHIDHQTQLKPNRTISVNRSFGWYAVAASVLIALGFWWFGQYNNDESQLDLPAVMRIDSQEPQLVSPFKTIQGPLSVRLPDGSHIQLSAHSSLRYPNQFEAGQREVYLIGDAFFEVVRRPQQPFIVHTNKLVTKVLGTSFWVSENADNQQISVVVRTGKVAVYVRNTSERMPDNNQSVMLIPNQQAVFEPTQERLSKGISDNPVPLISAAGLDFDEAPIEQIFTAIEKLYGIPIDYNHDQLATCTLTTSIDKLPLFDQLKLVCRAVNATYEQKDGHIKILGGGCH